METSIIRVRELFFYLFFAVMFGMRMWGIYEGKALYGPLLLLGFALWGISIFMTEHTVLEYLVMGAFMVLASLVYINSGEKGLLLYFALMLGMKAINEKSLFRVGIVVGLAGMAVMTFLATFGIIEDTAYIQYRAPFGEIFRRSLGFPHPNTLSSSFTIIAIMIMYVIDKSDWKKALKTAVILGLIAVYLFIFSGSRTGVMITFLCLTAMILVTFKKQIGLFDKIVIGAIYVGIWAISVVASLVLPDALLKKLDSMDQAFFSRWVINKNFFINNRLSLFGIRINNPDEITNGLDMSQFYLFLQLGLVAFVVVSILWIVLLWDECKENRIGELVVTLCLLLMGITDPFLYNIGFKNMAFVFMGMVLYKLLDKAVAGMPEVFGRKIQILKIGDKELEVPGWAGFMTGRSPAMSTLSSGSMASSGAQSANRQRLVFGSLVCLSAIVAIIIYVTSASPKLVLSDNDSVEHIPIEGMIGQTYTEEEIKDIRDEGNYVLNYTDENELMYTYYADEADAVKGGHYAPAAAGMEKLRVSLSIFFWGVMVSAGATQIFRKCTYKV